MQSLAMLRLPESVKALDIPTAVDFFQYHDKAGTEHVPTFMLLDVEGGEVVLYCP